MEAAASPGNFVFIRFTPAQMFGILLYALSWFFVEACQAVVLYMLWTYVEQYDKYTICFQVLLFFGDLYHKTLDAKNCYLMIILMMTSVFMAFHAESFFGSVLLMTLASKFLKPIDDFQKCAILKCAFDVFITFLQFKWRSFKTEISSRFTDCMYILLFAFYELIFGLNIPNYNTIEDLHLVLIFAMHSYVWRLRLYKMSFLYLTCVLYVSWMFIKTYRHGRRRSALIEQSVAIPEEM